MDSASKLWREIERDSHWWWRLYKKIRKHLLLYLVVVVVAVLVVLAVLVFLGYIFQWGWVGVKGKPIQAKTLWDWFQLLIIPTVITVGGILYNYVSSRNEREANKQRAEIERELAEDEQREVALRDYFDRMTELILDKKLRESKPIDEVRKIAQVRTEEVLDRIKFDEGWRKKTVLNFLYKMGLIDKGKPIIHLRNTGFGEGDLQNIVLRNADLSGVSFNFVSLLAADLSGSNLQHAGLDYVNFREAVLIGANLKGAKIRGCNDGYKYIDPYVRADFSGADFSGATIKGDVLTGADVTGAVFDGTRIDIRADLSDCNITPEQKQKVIFVDEEADLQSFLSKLPSYEDYRK